MKIAITGGTGTIGQAIIEALYATGDDDITSYSRTEQRMAEAKQRNPHVNYLNWNILEGMNRTARFDCVIHTAAMKHVPECEANPFLCYQTNVEGTYNVLAALKTDRFIYISTDKAVEPVSVMGASKMIAEKLVQAQGGIVVRLVNIMPSAGSVFGIWKKQYEEKKPLTITHPEMMRYFMTAKEAADLVVTAMKIGMPGDLFVPAADWISMGGLANLIAPGYPTEIIGARPGERMEEKIVTHEEGMHMQPLSHAFLVRFKGPSVRPGPQYTIKEKVQQTLDWGAHATN